MLIIITALVAGYFIGLGMEWLTTCIARDLHGKVAPAEAGTINCPAARASSVRVQSCRKNISDLWNRYLRPFLNAGLPGKCHIGKRAHVALVSSLFTGIVVWHFGVTFSGLAALLCLYFLILLGFIDSRTGYLPDCLNYPFLCVGLFVNIQATFVPLDVAALSAASAYLIFRMANASCRFMTGNDGIGQGDVKMITAIGAWFGWVCLIFIVVVASLFAMVTGLIRMFSGKQYFEEYFPFGPYLAIAAVPVLLYGNLIMQTVNDFS